MIRLLAIGLLGSVLLGAGACAPREQSGATSQQPARSVDRLDPVNAFPQVRTPSMRQ